MLRASVTSAAWAFGFGSRAFGFATAAATGGGGAARSGRGGGFGLASTTAAAEPARTCDPSWLAAGAALAVGSERARFRSATWRWCVALSRRILWRPRSEPSSASRLREGLALGERGAAAGAVEAIATGVVKAVDAIATGVVEAVGAIATGVVEAGTVAAVADATGAVATGVGATDVITDGDGAAGVVAAVINNSPATPFAPWNCAKSVMGD